MKIFTLGYGTLLVATGESNDWPCLVIGPSPDPGIPGEVALPEHTLAMVSHPDSIIVRFADKASIVRLIEDLNRLLLE